MIQFGRKDQKTSPSVEELARAISEKLSASRHVIAIAGPPGAGKSTVTADIAAALNSGLDGSAAVVPMDGFHFDDAVLNARGWRPRKGAPHTFDVGGLLSLLQRLRANAEEEIFVPVFDRQLELSRGSARPVPQSVRYILVEGNYLLLDQEPWTRLRQMFDLTILVTASWDVLRQRLVERWTFYNLDADGIRAKLEENDLPNGHQVLEHSTTPDILVRTGEE